MKKILITIVTLFFLSSIFAMSGDGGNEPPKDTKEVKQITVHEVENTILPERDESYPVKTIQTKRGEFSYFRASDGDIMSEKGRCLVRNSHIVKDSIGKGIVLDKNRHFTGLTVDEYVQHMADYECRIDEILEEKGIDKDTIDGKMWKWYRSRINLDKLDELKENGYDPYPHKINESIENIDNFLSVAIWSESIIIGKVIGSEKLNSEETGYDYKYRIQIDEIIKSSKEIENKSIVECLFYQYHWINHMIPINQKVVISLDKSLHNKPNSDLLRLFTWYDFTGSKVTQNKNFRGNKKLISSEEFKNKVRKLIEINDENNFYKRSWKEVE